jgi:hypothetical protein
MYEYQKKQAAALLIADTLNPNAIRELIEELAQLAELKEKDHAQ